MEASGGRAGSGGDRGLRLFHRIDHGHDNSPGASVQHAFDVVVGALRDSRKRNAASVSNRAKDRRPASAIARLARERMPKGRPVPLYIRPADAAPPREAPPVILP